MLSRIKTFGLQKNYMEYEKNVGDKFVHLKKIYKFSPDYFLIGHVVVVLIATNVIKIEKFRFVPNLCKILKKCWKAKFFVAKIPTN